MHAAEGFGPERSEAEPASSARLGSLRYLPAGLAGLLAAAHFLRAGEQGLVAVSLLVPLLLFSRRRWVLRLVQLFFAGMTVEWLATMWRLIELRQAMAAPTGRLGIILGSVVTLTALAAMILQHRTVLRRHRMHHEGAGVSLGALAVAVVILGAVHVGVARPMLLVERFWPSWGWLEVLVLGCWAGFLGERMASVKEAPRWRGRLWTLFSAVFFAQVVLGLAGLERFLQTGSFHLPIPALIVAGPVYRGEGFFMVILFLATLVLVGPAWCSHLCYIGAWDHHAASALRRSQRISPWGPRSRWLTLVVLLGVALLLRVFGFSGAVAAGLAAGFGLIGVGLMVTWSRRRGLMTHCIAWCPIGLLATRLGKINPFRIRLSHDACTSCLVCTFACRFAALSPVDIARRRAGPDCTLCGDCLASCSQSAIGYHAAGLSPAHARKVFLALVIGLHAAFLGVARI